MGTIKFRGKSIETNEWVHGFYYEVPAPLKCVGKREEPKGYIIKERPNSVNDWGMLIPMVAIEVDRNTICQFTGMVDKDNKEIYENDILKFTQLYNIPYDTSGDIETKEFYTDVKWEEGGFWIKDAGDDDYRDFLGAFIGDVYPLTDIEVVGNIYDNPELIGEKDEADLINFEEVNK